MPVPIISDLRAALVPIVLLFVGGAVRMAGGDDQPPPPEAPGRSRAESPANDAGMPPGYRGVLTFATPGNGDPFSPTVVQELDLGTGEVAVRFNGVDPSRGRSGELAFLQRLAGGYYADHGVVVVDSRGVPGAPLFVCKGFAWSHNRMCDTPKLSPDGRLVAFGVHGGGGTLCQNNYGMYWGSFIVVKDRRGTELARFEGYAGAEWLPDGRLLMMGTACRDGGIYIADRALGEPARVDGGQVATPGWAPAVSPDGRQLAFVWNNQLWGLSLTGQPALTQLTQLPKSVSAAAWSPDGSAIAVIMFDVSMPVKAVVLFRPGDESSVAVHQLPVYPYGPLSWR